jgi:hypothetical protein
MPLFGQPASLLQTTTDPVDVGSAAPPSAGQVLTATSATAAGWAAPVAAVTSVSATGNVTTTSTTDVLLTGMTITPGAGNYLVMFSCQQQNNVAASSNIFSIYVNGVQVAASSRQDRITTATINQAVALQTYVVGVLAGQVIEVRWRVPGGPTTGTVSNRELTILKAA